MIDDKEFTGQSVDNLKRKLISQYVYLMSGILLAYSVVFYFIIKDAFFAASTLIYSVIMFYTFMIIRKSYNIKMLVHLYMSYAPLFAGFIMLDFWKFSAATAMWLLPVPLGAHIFLGKKYIYIYTLYILLIIVAVSILTRFFVFDYFALDDVKVIVASDTFVGVSNIAVLGLLLYYNEKIRKAEIEDNILTKIGFSGQQEMTDMSDDEALIEKDKMAYPNLENTEK